MERDKIVKALECCAISIGGCRECPFWLNVGCKYLVMNDALALIRELTEDNQAQAETITNLIATIGNAQPYVAQQLLDQLKDMAQIRYNSVGVSFLTVDMADIERVVKKILKGETDNE